MRSAGRFFAAELGKTSQSTMGIFGSARFELRQDELQIADNRLRRGLVLEVVRADQQHVPAG